MKIFMLTIISLLLLSTFSILTPQVKTNDLDERTGLNLERGGSPTVGELAAAVLTPSTVPLLVSASMTGNDIQFEANTIPLQGFPTNGPSWALISTGKASNIEGVATTFYSYDTGGPTSPPYSHRGYPSYDIATLSLTLYVPIGATTLSFDWKFGTEENPTYIGQYVDWARAIVTTSYLISTNILLLPDGKPVDVDNAIPFSNSVTGDSMYPLPPYPSPNDVVFNAMTGMYRAKFNVAPFVDGVIRIDFQVGDENDRVLDSALFIDNLNIEFSMIKPVEGEMLYPRNAFRGYYYESYYKHRWYQIGDYRLNTLVLNKINGFHKYVGEVKVGDIVYENYKVYHEGIDIWTEPREGKTIYAPASGTIVYVDNVDNSPAGKWIWIWHGDIRKRDGSIASSISTRYLHLETIDQHILNQISDPDKVNIPISQGMPIGTVGDTGSPGIYHLHFEVRKGDMPKYPKATDVYNTMPQNPCEFIDYQPYQIPPREVFVDTSCPVDLVITDPDGLIISKEINQLPTLAQYIEVKYYGKGEDGDDFTNYDEIIINELKIGRYLITVIPEPGTSPTDTYNLQITSAEATLIIAEDIPISNIPTNPYILDSTETGVIPIIPATIDFDPDTLNLKSKGTWVTVYIELPVGHGYDVSMINLASVKLNGKVPAEAKPIDIGDYDGDGVPDLMVKFNWKLFQDILNIGVKIKITTSGKLGDGRTFEGSDIIRVI